VRRSLQGRLFPGSVRQSLLLVVLVVLLPLLVVQTGIYVAWFHSRRANEEEANLEAARAMAATFAAFVRDVARQELAIGTALTQPSAVSAEQLHKFLALSADEYPSIRAWHWVSAAGKVLASSEPAAVGRSVAAEPYFRDMFSNRAPNQDWGVSDLLEDPAGGQPTFVIARRIVDDKKVVRGIMIAEIEAGELGDLALPLSREAEGACTVFDRQGRMAYSDLPELRTHLDWRDDDPLLSAVLDTRAESSGTFVSPIDGQRRIAARVPVPGIGWVVGAGRPLRAAMAGIYRGLWIALGLNLAIGAVSAAVAAAFGRRIVRQLGRLQQHAQAVGRGDLSHRTEIAGIAELGELAAAFNRMGEDLHRAREEQSMVLEAFFKHSMTCLVFLDREFNFLRVNQTYAKACRRDASEFPGHNHFEFYPHAENEAIFREVVRSKTPYHAVAKPFTFPDHPEWGTTYWDWTLVPILNAAGEVEFLIFALDDVTERKRAEEELNEYRQHLEELVKQRTRELELSNQQLQKEIAERRRAAEALKRAADELARSNRELEQFAYVASHDLQEPLRVVTGYLQLIQRRYQDKIDSDADQFIHYAVDGAARMQQLITDLLDYSRVGTQGRPFAPTSVEAVLDKVLVNLQMIVRDTDAAVTRDPLPTVLADETQLIQLFQNLIGNGIKFRSGRRPEIHVSARQEEGRWLLSVRDNGIGIDPQYWEQIFVIFQRLHTRQKYSGTGIGLAICKRIVERHGGRIWLESRPGEGSTFCFTI